MHEQLISFETAKLAKEKGFDIPVIYVFDDIDGTLTASYVKNVFDLLNYNTSIHKCSRPTQSLLQKWLREKHKIHISINYHDYNFIVTIINMKNDDDLYYNVSDNYEKVLEIGLQEALKLI